MVEVTCAIIIKDAKVLICQRSATMKLPLKWEFPGGKVEPGEDERETIVREIKEELQLDIEILNRLEPVEYDYTTFRIYLIPFMARLLGGTLRLAEHANAQWVTSSELEAYDWAPADVPIVQQLKAGAAIDLDTSADGKN